MGLPQPAADTDLDISLARLEGRTLLHTLLVIACSPIIPFEPRSRRYMLERQAALRAASARLSTK